MTTLPINADAVTERINAMRITAEQSLSRVQTAVEQNGNAVARVVAAYRTIVADTGARLVRAQVAAVQALAAKPGDPELTGKLRRTVELLTTWAAHAKGYTWYERPATEAEKGKAIAVGWAGIVIALAAAGAVIAVSFTGVAWAVVHYKEAQTLADEVALIERDPAIADALARLNATAPRSPSPTVPDAGGGGGAGVGWLVAALGLAGAAFFILPKLGK
ncbi:MAG: hypothetical protein ACOZNI_27985 [Myxococcota bacterium]